MERRFNVDNPDKSVHIPQVAAVKPQDEEDEDEDIFEGVGAEYNPLAGLGDEDEDDSSSSSSNEGEEGEDGRKGKNANSDPRNGQSLSPKESEPKLPQRHRRQKATKMGEEAVAGRRGKGV